MAYTLAEIRADGGECMLGEPIEDLIVAKVIAARRALHSHCITVVCRADTREEVARYDPQRAPKSSERRLRSAVDHGSEWNEATGARKRFG